MLNYIWMGFIVIGFFIAMLNGRIEEAAQAAVDSAGKAVELSIALLGVLCLWTGLMSIAEKSGIIRYISRIARPILKFVFPGIPERHPAMGMVMMNLSANFLGLGNAATPLGLKAMSELQKLNKRKDTATDAMCMFLVLNTSAVQLIPATIIALRSKLGSSNPSGIIGTIWAASVFANIVGITVAKMLAFLYGRKRR